MGNDNSDSLNVKPQVDIQNRGKMAYPSDKYIPFSAVMHTVLGIAK